MKRNTLAILAVLALCAALVFPAVCAADTDVDVDYSRDGRFWVVTITLTADATGGAVADYPVDLSRIWDAIRLKPYFFYWVWTTPDADNAPDPYTVTFTDPSRRNATVLDLSARSSTAAEPASASEDLPGYWPVTGDLLLSVSDIGANGKAVIEGIFSE